MQWLWKLIAEAVIDRLGAWLKSWLDAIRERQRVLAEGRAESDARHAREAEAAEERMRKARERPLPESEIDRLLEKGEA